MTALSPVSTAVPPLGTADASRPHAVVIGAGFGGLAAAVRLSARGYQVTVVDHLDQAGGRARVFRQDGFVFDAGPTVITAPFLLEELWSLMGRSFRDEIDLRPVDPFYRIRFHDGDTFNYNGDPEAMRREVGRVAPDDVAGYEAFVRESERVFDVGFRQLAHVPFSRPWDMARIVPDMVRLGSHRTVYRMVSRYVTHERLRQVLSFHPLLVGGNPFSTTSIYSLIAFLERKWGVHFPMGGTGRLVAGLVDLIESAGNRILLGQRVTEIATRGRRATGVRLESGEHLPADIVVSNGDPAWIYQHLVPPHLRRRWTDRRIRRSRFSMGLFVWYFGTNRRYDDVEHHTIMLGPRYRELLRDIFDRKVLAEDFSLYLHRPTATDPSLAPPGCDTFYVLSPVPHLDAQVDWSTLGDHYRDRIAQHLGATILPNLDRHLVSSRLMTPLRFEQDLLSFKGSAFSFEPTLAQSAYFRPHNRSEDIDGLYLVGAGTHPGAGVPGVLSSARVLDSIVPAPHAAR